VGESAAALAIPNRGATVAVDRPWAGLGRRMQNAVGQVQPLKFLPLRQGGAALEQRSAVNNGAVEPNTESGSDWHFSVRLFSCSLNLGNFLEFKMA
jgi:hypothetical protein